jgi:glycosyltransferase involved in cell wall biosynthesis
LPLYNRGNIIGYCLESLSKQDLSDFEVIIVDNESTDNTQDIIDIKVLNYPRSEFNLSKVRNFGIKHVMNELIIIIDSDIIACSDFIARHIAIHKRENNNVVIGYCFANNHFYDKDIFFSGFSDSNILFSDEMFLNKSKYM